MRGNYSWTTAKHVKKNDHGHHADSLQTFFHQSINQKRFVDEHGTLNAKLMIHWNIINFLEVANSTY